jgi:hypothetical protein
LNSAIRVNCQTVTVNFHRVTINQDIPLDQGQVNLESFGISRQRTYQFRRRDTRQKASISALSSKRVS